MDRGLDTPSLQACLLPVIIFWPFSLIQKEGGKSGERGDLQQRAAVQTSIQAAAIRIQP